MGEYELIILGGGPAGYVAALRAALHLRTSSSGKKQRAKHDEKSDDKGVLLVDDQPFLGGTCLNEGCIPSKTLLHHSWSTFLRQTSGLDASRDASKDLSQGQIKKLWEEMQEEKSAVVKNLGEGVAALMKARGIDFVCGEGRVHKSASGGLELLVASKEPGQEEQRFRGRRLLLATGSEPIELPGLTFDGERIISSKEALSLREVPKRLAVLGAGVIGLELSSIFARLGSHVDLFELADRSCGDLDRDLSKNLEKVLKKQGLTLYLKTKIDLKSIKRGKAAVSLLCNDEPLAYDYLLVAVGRKASLRGLESLGLKQDARGHLQVNNRFETTIEGVYAVGDLIDGAMLAHKASEEALVVVDALFGEGRKINYVTIPNVIYTSPEIASVGLSEEQAKAYGLELLIGKSIMRGNSRARCSQKEEGIVKIVAHKESGRILGLHIMAHGASEMIALGSIALAKELTVKELAFLPFAHPTMSEAIREAAWSALGQPLHH